MMSSDISLDVYNHAPEPHPNPVLGSLQVLAWLFFHPSAWCHDVRRLDTTLRPDFCLAELQRTHWHNPRLRQQLLQRYCVWLCCVSILVLLILLLLDVPGRHVLHGVAFGVGVGMTAGCIIGGVISVAGGVISCVLGGVLSGVVRGVIGDVGIGAALGGLTSLLASGIASIAISVVAGVASRRATYPLSRQLGSILIGLVIAGLVTSGAILIARRVETSSWLHIPAGGVVGIVAGGVLWLRTGQWRRGLLVGLATAIVAGMASSGATLKITIIPASAVGGVADCLLFSLSFILSYALAECLAGPWAGAVASAFGGGICLALISVDPTARPTFLSDDAWRMVPPSLGIIVLGLTHALWRPMLCYPFQAVWSVLLYRVDEQRRHDLPSLLRWHAAFWDEWQRLPLPFLDAHVVLVAERDLVEGQAALAYLTTSHQHWAARAAQMELDARRFMQCADVVAISKVDGQLVAEESEGPANSVLRSLGRISQDVAAALSQDGTYNQRLALTPVEERLEQLLRELTRSRKSYARRFYPIVGHWRQLIAMSIRQLAEAAEQRQEIDNPYVLGVPLTSQQDLFVGRTDIGAQIEQLLVDRRRPPLLLYGQRRMGKTSLLHNLGRLLPSTIIPLFVDLQGPVSIASDHTGLLYNLARAMADSSRRQRDIVLPRLTRETLATDPFTHFDEWLDEVEHLLDPRTVLLALDEFEALDEALSAGQFSEVAVLGMLRHLIQHRPRFKVLLAGSHTLAELQRWARYLINVELLHLSYLQESEARHLIERPVPDFALDYDPVASQQIIDLTRCHPYLVQLLCAEVVGLKNTQPTPLRRRVQVADVEAAVPRAIRKGSLFFADIARNQVDPFGRAVLRFLAVQGGGTVIAKAGLTDKFPQELHRSLTLLTQRELIEEVEEGFRFQVELIRRWFAEEHDYFAR